MRFWKTLIPDEPFISDGDGAVPAQYRKAIPPAVKAWCVVSVFANALVAGLATVLFQNVAPMLLCAFQRLVAAMVQQRPHRQNVAASA